MSNPIWTFTLDMSKDGSYHIWTQKKEHLTTREQEKFRAINKRISEVVQEVIVRAKQERLEFGYSSPTYETNSRLS